MLGGVIEIQDAHGVGKTVLHQIPNPHRAVRHDVDALGLMKATA